jgi:hypothetical protein
VIECSSLLKQGSFVGLPGHRSTNEPCFRREERRCGLSSVSLTSSVVARGPARDLQAIASPAGQRSRPLGASRAWRVLLHLIPKR